MGGRRKNRRKGQQPQDVGALERERRRVQQTTNTYLNQIHQKFVISSKQIATYTHGFCIRPPPTHHRPASLIPALFVSGLPVSVLSPPAPPSGAPFSLALPLHSPPHPGGSPPAKCPIYSPEGLTFFNCMTAYKALLNFVWTGYLLRLQFPWPIRKKSSSRVALFR